MRSAGENGCAGTQEHNERAQTTADKGFCTLKTQTHTYTHTHRKFGGTKRKCAYVANAT